MLKIRQIVLFLTSVCLAVLLAACAPAATTGVNLPDGSNLPMGSIAVLKNGTDFAAISVSTIGATALTASFTKKGGVVEEHAYQVTALSTLLEKSGLAGIDGITQVVITAKDGYAAVFTLEEIQQADNVYLASQIDSQPIKGSDGKPAAMVLAKGDDFSNRWVNDILKIDIITG